MSDSSTQAKIITYPVFQFLGILPVIYTVLSLRTRKHVTGSIQCKMMCNMAKIGGCFLFNPFAYSVQQRVRIFGIIFCPWGRRQYLYLVFHNPREAGVCPSIKLPDLSWFLFEGFPF